MPRLEVSRHMEGCRVVSLDGRTILFGQPPEVLKSLLKARSGRLDALVLPDVRERCGALLNNVEFLLYYFLFFDDGLQDGRRLKLIGEPVQIAQVLEALRLALLGPTESELIEWGTDPEIRTEWLNASRFFALKDAHGEVRPVQDFFDSISFREGVAAAGEYAIRRVGCDRFEVSAGEDSVEVDLNDVESIDPPYAVPGDYITSGLVRFGVEVLGGASGFSTEQASTGLVLCVNGNYILIDSIPYLDHHLRARGIAKNQISAMFLTHLHDDHCNMFSLMLMPHKIDVITTREIYGMAMSKLSLGLGWPSDVIAEHFNLVEIKVGEPLRYHGLEIDAHCTVHSIPTIGATFRAFREGQTHEICLVGDIQTFTEIGQMRRQGLVREETERYLRDLYTRRFDLLIADGGMGPIHGDPADALQSQSERVVFVHVEELPARFNATFSLASSGKRYTIMDGDSDIYTMRTIELLMDNFPRRLSRRWASTLFADKSFKRYNTDDVIIKQGSATWGNVFLILAGYCEVIHHDGDRFETLATREAGDLMGEMAVVTGRNLRNASVVARTPVMACEFSEHTFNRFLEEEGLKEILIASWSRRPMVSGLPQFHGLSTRVLDGLCGIAQEVVVPPGEAVVDGDGEHWDIIGAGSAVDSKSAEELTHGCELGRYRPFLPSGPAAVTSPAGCTLVRFEAGAIQRLIQDSPQLNYTLRKYRQA